MQNKIRQLAAVMFTDMVGYTALMQKDENQAIKNRDHHRKILNQLIQDHFGLILQYYGDGSLSVFGSVVDAVDCAVKIQQELQKEPQVPLRIGIHVGDITYSDDGVYGDAVNVASRIEKLSASGGVLISDKVCDEIKNHTKFSVTSIGEFELKNVKKPVELFALTNKGLQIPTKKSAISPERKRTVIETKENQYPLLETKLYIPQPRSDLVQRTHLIDRLSSEIYKKLTLISAPAGFGKTTIISKWLSCNEMPAAWISLDKSDNDHLQFFHYLIAALKNIDSRIGQPAMAMLLSPQLPPLESVMTSLIKEITKIPNDFVLVLDDYHSVDDKQVHHIVEFLLDHLPVKMHVVITTRVDPPLSLARLRVRNQLTEFRATDLCFSLEEATDFFNKLMNLKLSNHDISILESRTEGWIAGLQLAALSMQGRKDIKSFVKSFAGDDRHIVDYLAEEVLNLQPEPVRNFLLQTSILNRLSASLCDYVTDKKDSQKILDELDRTNLFIVPLDSKRNWYRYHHLFADLLRQALQQKTTSSTRDDELDIAELHKRASIWYEENGLEIEAFHHAVTAGDLDRAASLLELAYPAMDGRFQLPTWLSLAKALPDELVRVRPVLCLGYAWAVLDDGDLEAAEARLRDAEHWLDNKADLSEQKEELSAKMVVVDKEQFRSLPVSITLARAYIAQSLGDIPGSVNHARQALDLLPETDHLRRGVAAALLGLAYWAGGELEAAYQSISDGMASMQLGGNILFASSGVIGLADIRLVQGRLRDAETLYEQSLQLATERGESVQLVMANLYLGLSMLYSEQGEQEAATQHLAKSKEQGEQASVPDWPYRFCIAQARLKEIQGDFAGVLELLDEAEKVYYRNPMPDMRPVAALKTRVWIKQGKLTEALDWVRKRNLSIEDNLRFLNEFEHITLARVLIARYKSDHMEHSMHEAMELLQRLLKAAKDGGRIGSVIEILLLQALVHQIQDNVPNALESLEHAITLAEPEGYIRIFVDEGPPMAELLEKLIDTKVEVSRSYVKKLLSMFKLNKLIKTENGVVEALSEREIEVLRFIAAGLSNKKIMEELFLSLSTVKTHIRNIYSKLNVHSRTEAIVKAKEMNLL